MNQSLANNPPSERYLVTNWALRRGSSRWPAWDVIAGRWLSGDLLLAPEVKSTIATRRRRSLYRGLYVYLKGNQMSSKICKAINLETHGVVILDSLGRRGLAPDFPHRHRLWAIHYDGDERSLEGGLYGDVIPSWCTALHAAFSAILNAASQGPCTAFKDVQVAPGRPSPWPYLCP